VGILYANKKSTARIEDMQMLERLVSELLQEDPRRAQIFEQYAIDYCCCNHLTLAETCQEKQINPETILKSLAETAPHDEDSFVSVQLGALSDDIVARHHSFVREQGGRILPLLEKVCQVHGQREPRLLAIKTVFQDLHQDLLLHMQKEERVLFPFCKELENSQVGVEMHCGSVANPIQMMLYEHDLAAEQMKQLQFLSEQFTPPNWACNSFLALYQALKDYHQDLEIHMHLENNLLFPAALRRESKLQGDLEWDAPSPFGIKHDQAKKSTAC
jgi:regulator of cell morphogenesis and NO signaling